MAHATLYDFRDIDLMLKLADEADENGQTTTAELASALGFAEDDLRPMGIRLAWMRRYGFLGYDEKAKLWRLSSSGERIVKSNVRATTIAAIERVPDEAFVDVMAHVTSRYRHADPVTATLLRREFAFGTSPKSAAYNGRGR
jgi:hypothetical protein